MDEKSDNKIDTQADDARVYLLSSRRRINSFLFWSAPLSAFHSTRQTNSKGQTLAKILFELRF